MICCILRNHLKLNFKRSELLLPIKSITNGLGISFVKTGIFLSLTPELRILLLIPPQITYRRASSLHEQLTKTNTIQLRGKTLVSPGVHFSVESAHNASTLTIDSINIPSMGLSKRQNISQMCQCHAYYGVLGVFPLLLFSSSQYLFRVCDSTSI